LAGVNSIIDLNRGGHSGSKDHAGGHLIDMDADLDALGQAHPVKIGPLIVGLRVGNVDSPGDALDVTVLIAESLVPLGDTLDRRRTPRRHCRGTQRKPRRVRRRNPRETQFDDLRRGDLLHAGRTR
jgi:hypothetical protein